MGFATVIEVADPVRKRAETLEMLYPLKGAPGTVTMAPGWRDNAILMGETGTSVRTPQGSLLFVALSELAEGAVVNECLAVAMARQDRSELIRALFEVSRER